MLRKQSDETNPADWFYAGGERLRAADVLWSAEGLTPSGIALLQASLERYLKGYLIAHGWRLIKTHDLGLLLTEAIRLEPRFGQFKGLATELTKDYFAQHYPGGDWSDIGENYEWLRQKTSEMLDLIRQNIPQYFSTENRP